MSLVNCRDTSLPPSPAHDRPLPLGEGKGEGEAVTGLCEFQFGSIR